MIEKLKTMIDRYISIWRELGFYQRFEQVVAIFLTIIISLVIIASVYRLGVTVIQLLILRVDVTNFEVFQLVFGMILTVLIALEFNHSIVQVVERRQSIVQVRVVVQIAVLAIVRKFILLDLSKTDPSFLFGLAALIVSLAALYWGVFASEGGVRILRRRDDESAADGH